MVWCHPAAKPEDWAPGAVFPPCAVLRPRMERCQCRAARGFPPFSKKDCTQSSTSGAGLSSSAPSQRREKKSCIFPAMEYNRFQTTKEELRHAAHHLGPGHGAARGGASAPGTAQPQVHDGFKIGKPAAQLQPGGRPLHRRLFPRGYSRRLGGPDLPSCGATFWAIGSPRRP